jgi:hypothetical protein
MLAHAEEAAGAGAAIPGAEVVEAHDALAEALARGRLHDFAAEGGERGGERAGDDGRAVPGDVAGRLDAEGVGDAAAPGAAGRCCRRPADAFGAEPGIAGRPRGVVRRGRQGRARRRAAGERQGQQKSEEDGAPPR